jgi:hypothetical protein
MLGFCLMPFVIGIIAGSFWHLGQDILSSNNRIFVQISQHWFPDRQRTMATTLIGMSYPLGIVVGQGGSHHISSLPIFLLYFKQEVAGSQPMRKVVHIT